MFNPGVALINLSRMLKPGGRMICMESAASWNCPYIMFSPAWFYDFFVVNRYADCKVYLATYRDNHQLTVGPWDMSYVNVPCCPNGPSPEALDGNHFILLVIAEKAGHSTDDRQPIHAQYRIGDAINAEFATNAAAFDRSPRPLLGGTVYPAPDADYLVSVGQLGLDLIDAAAITD